jgi:hypothetical protein
MNSELTDYGQQGCDMGVKSNVLWVYDASAMLYKRILLYADGDNKFVNQSNEAKALVERYCKHV